MIKRKASHWNVCYTNIVVTILLFITIYLIITLVPNERAMDIDILQSIQNFLAPYPSYIFVFFNEFGRENCMFWPQFSACAVLVSHNRIKDAFLLEFWGWTTHFANLYLKDLIQRPRPRTFPQYSFPSGHSSTTMCFYGILIYLTFRYCRGFWRYFLITFFSAYIIMTGIARMWLGVHFLTDVLAGFCLGFIFINLFVLTKKFLER